MKPIYCYVTSGIFKGKSVFFDLDKIFDNKYFITNEVNAVKTRLSTNGMACIDYMNNFEYMCTVFSDLAKSIENLEDHLGLLD